jgi:hypothetical protein
MQSHVEAVPVPNTNVVELIATGPHREVLAPMLNAIIEAYAIHLAETYRTSSAASLAQAEEEVKKLEGSVAAKRREVESFRLRYNIVSLERDENQILAQTRDLSTSLSAANERVAKAEGRLQALAASAAAGKTVVKSKDDPTLANLEQRASRPLTPGTVSAQILSAAHDAGIDGVTDVTSDCLRHTYVAFLVRQGIRFADLTHIVGHLPAAALGAYSALSPPGPLLPRDAINVIYPVSAPHSPLG